MKIWWSYLAPFLTDPPVRKTDRQIDKWTDCNSYLTSFLRKENILAKNRTFSLPLLKALWILKPKSLKQLTDIVILAYTCFWLNHPCDKDRQKNTNLWWHIWAIELHAVARKKICNTMSRLVADSQDATFEQYSNTVFNNYTVIRVKCLSLYD